MPGREFEQVRDLVDRIVDFLTFEGALETAPITALFKLIDLMIGDVEDHQMGMKLPFVPTRSEACFDAADGHRNARSEQLLSKTITLCRDTDGGQLASFDATQVDGHDAHPIAIESVHKRQDVGRKIQSKRSRPDTVEHFVAKTPT